MEIGEKLLPPCESWNSGVLPVLGERTIQWEKTANPLETGLVWMIQSEGLRDNTTEQPRFEKPPFTSFSKAKRAK